MINNSINNLMNIIHGCKKFQKLKFCYKKLNY